MSISFVMESDLVATLLQVVAQTIQIFVFFILLGNFVAGISLFVRRLRDMGRKWLWVFWSFVPFVNIIFGIWILATPSKVGVTSSHSD